MTAYSSHGSKWRNFKEKYVSIKVKKKGENSNVILSLFHPILFTPTLIPVSVDSDQVLSKLPLKKVLVTGAAWCCRHKNTQLFLLSEWAGLIWNHMEHIFPLRFDDNAPRQCRLCQRKWLNCILWCVCFSFSYLNHWLFWKTVRCISHFSPTASHSVFIWRAVYILRFFYFINSADAFIKCD